MKTLISGAVVLTCDEAHTVLTPGDVVFEGDRIAYVGPSYAGEYDVRLPGAGRLLMPGLINAHTHSGMSIFRSLADDDDLMTFLTDRVWPREIRLTPDDVYAGSLLAATEMLKAGVTTYVDMYFHEDALLRAAVEAGARAVISPTVLDVPLWTPILGTWDAQLRRTAEFCETWEGHLSRIHTALGPHAPYTVTLEALREIGEEARRLGRPINIHLVETEFERNTFDERGIGSTARALEEIGFFDGPVIAAHSIWLDDGDVDIYARHDVGVAHCPGSNAKLACGTAPVVAMLIAGVPVGLGTDGAATNNNHNLWEEIRLASLLQKLAAGDPKVVPAATALWMATRLGARAVRIDDIGVLKAGYRADMVMLDVEDTLAVPVFSPETYISHAVYSFGAQLVDSVWVAGQQVVKGREVLTVDEPVVRRAAQQHALDLSARAGVVTA
jgi:5-methylthioadenosine/S-adenosylhomocysteine deaminase